MGQPRPPAAGIGALCVTLIALTMMACGASPALAPARRAVYVRDAGALAQRDADRTRLASQIRAGVFTEVVPYGLGALLGAADGRAIAARWIDELHAAGARVIAPIAGADRLAALDALFTEHPQTYVDALITEREFWNRRDREPAFAEMMDLVADLRAAATRWSRPDRRVQIGIYVGHPTAAEAARLAAAIDFVYLDYSVRSPALAWPHRHGKGGPLRTRYAAFAAAGIELWPIFYATGEVDMSPALRADGLAAAESRFRADQRADRALAVAAPAGFAFFTFEALDALSPRAPR